FSSIDLVHQWIKRNNDKYEKNKEMQWFFFAYSDFFSLKRPVVFYASN
ncbi:MAG: hypothetical protein RLZZ143_1178, partial [Cyanobacteriota bacterium]